MWLLYARASPPDVPYWPGRRWLAAVDAIAWPLLWVVAIHQAATPEGILEPVALTVTLLCALGRLRRALWANHRYRFTTLRWGRILGMLLMLSAILKLVLPM